VAKFKKIDGKEIGNERPCYMVPEARTVRDRFDCPIRCSGHEVGLVTTVPAVEMVENLAERHITLDRLMWGADQATSVDTVGLSSLVRHTGSVGAAMGDGIKHISDSEWTARGELRLSEVS